jgi:magnesium transporter
MHAIAFRLLSKDEAIEVYEYLDYSVQERLIEELRSQEVREIVEQMSPDDRAKLFDELPAKIVKRLLEQLSPAERESRAQLLGYEAGTAGRIMTPELISVKENFTAPETLERIRSLANASEMIYYLYVTDAARRLTGILSLGELVTAQPQQIIGDSSTTADNRRDHDSRCPVCPYRYRSRRSSQIDPKI